MGRIPVWGLSLLAGAAGGACFGLLTDLFMIAANLFYRKSYDGMVVTVVAAFVLSIAAGGVLGGTVGGVYASAVRYLHLGFGADLIAALMSTITLGYFLQSAGIQPSGLLVGTITALLICNCAAALISRHLQKLPIRLTLFDAR